MCHVYGLVFFSFLVVQIEPHFSMKRTGSENGYKVLYPFLRILGNTLRNPSQVADLLLLQLRVAVKHPILELLQERLFVKLDFFAEEPVLEVGSSSQVVLACRSSTIDVVEEGTIL